MAGVRLEGMTNLENFIDGLGKLALDINDIAKDCVNEAAPTLEKALKNNISSATGKYSTGALAASIVPTEAKMNGYGVFAAIRPVGEDARGERNGEKLAFLEYGTSRQDAHPVLAKSVKQAETQVKEIIQKRFEEYVEKRMK